MIKLPSNFELDRYGLHVRLVREEDAEFILSLRNNPELNQYIHPTDTDAEKQRQWIREYKEREKEGLEYYFIYSMNGELFGLDRVYRINKEDNSYTWGSWICKIGISAAQLMLQYILSTDIINNNIGLEQCYYDVRKDNLKVLYFHRRTLRSEEIGETELDILFSEALKTNSDLVENIKNIKEYKFQDVKEEFGIKYDFNKFIIFNVVQSFIYKDKIDRDNEEEKVMKIIDSNNEEEVDSFLKSKVKHIYAAEYAKENQKQIKKQLEIISSELVNKIISSKEISEFNLLMKNGITKGYLTHKISNDSSKGYIDLKKQLLDGEVDVPLRYEKLKSILSGKDEKVEDLWNNGNALRTHRKDYQKFIQKNKPEIWEEICKYNLEHKYREKINRQGHSNSKKSYWAIGYDTLQDFYELSKEKDVNEYKKIHNNCCGLGDPKNSIKGLKKIERKKKRKEFREKKKSSSVQKDNKKEEKDSEEMMIRGRGRGGRFFRGRRRPARGRGGRGGSNQIKMKVEEEDKDENEDDKMEISDPDEDNDNIEEPIVGRKKKRTEKKLKQKDKEQKKMIKKINKLNKK